MILIFADKSVFLDFWISGESDSGLRYPKLSENIKLDNSNPVKIVYQLDPSKPHLEVVALIPNIPGVQFVQCSLPNFYMQSFLVIC